MYEAPTIVVASAARTTTGNSGALQCGATPVISLLVATTAASGTTPSMALSIEWSPDGGTTWCVADTADTFTAITTTTNLAKQFRVKSNTYRIVWTITGTTPSFTFSVREYDLGA